VRAIAGRRIASAQDCRAAIFAAVPFLLAAKMAALQSTQWHIRPELVIPLCFVIGTASTPDQKQSAIVVWPEQLVGHPVGSRNEVVP
jgi:hypothetical protein